MRWTLNFLVSLFLCAAAWAGSKPNPADYTITVHVSASKTRPTGERLVRLKVVIDGKKYELQAINDQILLVPGDYKAVAISPAGNDARAYGINARYELLFPDNKTGQYEVVGVWEK